MSFSVFDLDHTLLNKNSSVEFYKYLCKKKILSFLSLIYVFFYYVRHLYFGLTLEDLHRKAFEKTLRGFSEELLLRHVSEFLDEYLKVLLYQPVVSRLRRAQQLGHFTSIISAAPAFLVQSIAKRLNVDSWKASEYKVDGNRRLCQVGLVLQGKEKAYLVLEIAKSLCLSKDRITAYSDSYLDLLFLQSAGIAVVVNPDKKLKKIAQSMGWEEI